MPKIELIELHMAAAHFPIALLMSNVFFDVIGFLLKKSELRTTSFWIHLLGLVGAVVTIALGLIGNPFRADVGLIGNPFSSYAPVMAQRAVQHQWFGFTSFFLFGLLAVWRIKRADRFSKVELGAYWAMSLLAVGIIGLTGYLGNHVMD
jgi:uncharacterized membrane protein